MTSEEMFSEIKYKLTEFGLDERKVALITMLIERRDIQRKIEANIITDYESSAMNRVLNNFGGGK